MIILNSYYSSVHDLAYILYTKPRSKAARAFAKPRSSSLCPYCKNADTNPKARHKHACVDCDKRISRMLQTKSRIIHGSMSLDALLRLQQDYKYFEMVPLPLAGRFGDVTQVTDAIERCIQEYYKAEQVLREEALRCRDVSFAELRKQLRTSIETGCVHGATES